MSRTERTQDPIKNINNYLNSIDGIDEYVIVSEGFPLYWGKNIDQEKAEELAALATDMISSSHRYVSNKDRDYIILATETSNNYTGAIRLKPNLYLLARGEPNIVRRALLNIYHYLHSGVRCPWCGRDISLYAVKCRKGHSLPMGIKTCPLCGSRIEYFKCPYCGKLISPDGYKIEMKTPKENIIVSLILSISGIASIGISIITYNLSTIISSIFIAAAGLLFGLSYNGIKRKIPIQIRD